MEFKIIIDAFRPFATTLMILTFALFVGISMDYLTGTLAAKKNNEWSSKIAREGIWKKLGILLALLLAFVFDTVLLVLKEGVLHWSITFIGLFTIGVSLYYIGTEFGSIIENLGKMGTPIPDFLRKGIALFGRKTQEKAEAMLPNDVADLNTEELALGEAVDEAEPVRKSRFFVEDGEPPDEEDWDI